MPARLARPPAWPRSALAICRFSFCLGAKDFSLASWAGVLVKRSRAVFLFFNEPGFLQSLCAKPLNGIQYNSSKDGKNNLSIARQRLSYRVYNKMRNIATPAGPPPEVVRRAARKNAIIVFSLELTCRLAKVGPRHRKYVAKRKPSVPHASGLTGPGQIFKACILSCAPSR